MARHAVIVAGGSGSRMGGGMPKQFRNLCGRPVLWWSMKAFHDADAATDIILVLPEEFISLWNDFYATLPENQKFPHKIATGGKTRTESVSNGLALVADDGGLIAVHDGARPLVKPGMIIRGWQKAEEAGAAVPVVSVTDSLRHLEADGSRSVDRSEFVAVQTPQVFRTGILRDAYRKAGEKTFTDDAAVVENVGVKIHLYEGDPVNIKITNPQDMAVAAVIMSDGDRDLNMGNARIF